MRADLVIGAVLIGWSVLKPNASATPGGFAMPTVPGADPAIANIVGNASWPPSDIAGMARREGRFVILLEVGRVFSIDELAGIGALAGAAEH